jgi:hypothetical protein
MSEMPYEFVGEAVPFADDFLLMASSSRNCDEISTELRMPVGSIDAGARTTAAAHSAQSGIYRSRVGNWENRASVRVKPACVRCQASMRSSCTAQIRWE